MNNKKGKWDWKLFLLLLLSGILAGQLYRWVTNERCEYHLSAYGHGFWIETQGYQCKYLDEKCQDYANEGYACEFYRDNNANIFDNDYYCDCQLRYGKYDPLLDWRTETRPSGADNSD